MGTYDRRFLVHETFALGTESKVDEIWKLAPTSASNPPSENKQGSLKKNQIPWN